MFFSTAVNFLKFVLILSLPLSKSRIELSNRLDLLKYSYKTLSFQVVNIFNLFITFGDTFLPTPASYDQLYYELIRMYQVFDNLFYMGTLFIEVVFYDTQTRV